MTYPKLPYCVGEATSMLQFNRTLDKTVSVKPDLPGNVILIHGVNDVGVSYAAVEEGLCQGLDTRLYNISFRKANLFTPGTYRMPVAKDKDNLEPDPDAVFFKRKFSEKTHSPVIPFYWGFREEDESAKWVHGQRTDRYGNRLDKDLSKGGGPFSNATSTLPDMWGQGIFSPVEVGGDSVHPVLSTPGRMYMVLAAKRLAALITMIRDFERDEVVSIVAHSEGCMIALLAQAFLLDMPGQRPADTLILTHAPYSLVDDTSMLFKSLEFFNGGSDTAMEGQYDALATLQTFDARLQTLAKIVQGTVDNKNTMPVFETLTDQAIHFGMVGAKWSAAADRDNRGKVYLYFCPEDMTVALDNMQGIGWQGVPDHMGGTALSKSTSIPQYGIWGEPCWFTDSVQRKPLEEIGAGFFQRVFTNKKRLDLVKKVVGAVLVGQRPHDFVLRIENEDDHAHVAAKNRQHRARHDVADWPPKEGRWWEFLQTEAGKVQAAREGIRTINGEALPMPVPADLHGAGQIEAKDIPGSSEQAGLPASKEGPCEAVDPIDAAIAVTSDRGLNTWQEERPDPRGMPAYVGASQELPPVDLIKMTEQYNKQKNLAHLDAVEHYRIVRAIRQPALGPVLATVQESPNAARKRWQHEVTPKSFHDAIIGSRENHRNVTAYDVAIGGGQASSDPRFYAYLCAVADWRLKQGKLIRPSIMKWEDFTTNFHVYWNVEPKWRKDLIEGNAKYYSSGTLPECVPGLRKGLPTTVVCEILSGVRTVLSTKSHEPKQSATYTTKGCI